MSAEQSWNWDGLHITFGDRVRRLRIVLGMTQDEFGESLAYSGGAVARWEKMDHDPRSSKRILQAIQLVYGDVAMRFISDTCEPTDKDARGAA